jgi:hypothetical protein
MNLEQIIDEVNKDLDDSLDTEDILGWVNRCMDDLSVIAKKEDKKTADISSINAYELPDDVLEIVRVVVNGDDLDRTGYEVWNNVLSLQNGPDSGLLELYYYRRLAHLTDDTGGIPEIDPAFHDLFVLYTVAHNQFMEEEPEKEMDAMNRYYRRKQEYTDFMRKNSVRFNQTSKIKNAYSSYWG